MASSPAPAAMRGGGGGQRVHDVVLAGQRELDATPPGGVDQLEVASRSRLAVGRAAHVARREVGALAQPEGDDAAGAAGEAVPERGEAVVGVDHGGAVGAERLEHLALAARDALEAAEALEVRGPGVDDEADVGPRDRGQVRDLAGWFAPISITA